MAALVALTCAVSAGGGAAPSPAAAAARESAAALHTSIAHAMAAAGGESGAYVYDVSERRVLFEVDADVPRPPASVEKLYTSTTALVKLGPSARLQTSVLGVGILSSSGVWQGNLYLHGGGDPTFGSTGFDDATYGPGNGATVSQLALALRRTGVKRVDGRVLGDESLFDDLRGVPYSNYAPDPVDVEGILSALAFDRGESGNQRGLHAPAEYAAQEFAAELHHVGITVTGGYGVGVAPTGATRLASVGSPPLSTLLRLMDAPSDNYLAETLVKDIGAYAAGHGTTAAGARVVRETMAQLGLRISVVDGSGLSRLDETTPHQVVELLTDLTASPLGTVLRAALARPGQTGTLSDRMAGTAAVGRCQAKTGTLDFVSNLAGWCTALGGHTIVFAMLMDGIDVYTAHVLQDAITVAIAQFDDGTPAEPPPPPPPLLAGTGGSPTGNGGTGTTGPTGPTGATGATTVGSVKGSPSGTPAPPVSGSATGGTAG